MTNIREAIQTIAGTKKTKFGAFLAKVKSVDAADNVCDVEPLNDDAEMFDVRYRATIGVSAGFFAVPKVGSTVLVVKTSDDAGVIVSYSDVSEIALITDGQNNGGLVKIEALMERLNKIEQTVTNALVLIQTHTHAVASGVASPSPMLASMVTNTGTTIRGNLENTKVKH